ncbi:MAG: ribulose-phosphate 3-epimerase [Bacteroidota bacterium]|jgi:ribulose-phosphate 3-epimerase
MTHLVAPSLLSANFLNLEKDIEMVNRSQADWFHLDVMDGVFVPNISFGLPVIEKIKQAATKPLDVHLMIIDPDRFAERFRKAGADIISVHAEACLHLHRSVYLIKNTGAKAGVVLNPHSPVSFLYDIISDTDMVLLMSVNPGFGGQKFIANTYNKVRELKELILKKNSAAIIEIDGGVDLVNAPLLVKEGADVLVAGNTIFSAPHPEETIGLLKNF